MRRLAALVFVVLGLLASAARAEAELRVFAAASLTEVLERLAKGFPDAKLVTSLGSSSELARQIADGAPADVFLSASTDWTDFLEEKGALAGAVRVFARNELVCIASRGGALAKQPPRSPAALLAALGAGDLVAIADAGVPAGEYTRQALARAGLLEAYQPRLVGQKDVRAVLHAVEQGELQAGFVYATDARVADVEVLFRLDPALHEPIEYPAAVVRASERAALAQRFVDFLGSEGARSELARAGFVLP